MTKETLSKEEIQELFGGQFINLATACSIGSTFELEDCKTLIHLLFGRWYKTGKHVFLAHFNSGRVRSKEFTSKEEAETMRQRLINTIP